MKERRAFVTGATGVLGRVLVPQLLGAGWIVRALVRSPERAVWLTRPGVEIAEGDLVADGFGDRLPRLLEGCHAVVHAATAIPSRFDVPGAWDANTRLRTEGTLRLRDASLSAGVQAFVQQSITMAYRDGGDAWLDETAPLDESPERAAICAPVMAMEGMLRAVSPGRLSWSILRGGLFVGPGTGQDGLIARLRSGAETISGDARNFISAVHVEDMASAVVAALERAPGGSVFNVCADPLRLGDYQDRLATLVGAPPPRRDLTRPCPPSWRCSSEAARTWLGWKPSRGIWPGASVPAGSLATAASAADVVERGDLSARIRQGLRDVIDPELGVNVVDLGLVYRVTLDGDRVEVLLTMTSPTCPLGGHLASEAEAAVRRSAPGVGQVAVRLVLDPPWHPGLMSDAARRQLGWGG